MTPSPEFCAGYEVGRIDLTGTLYDPRRSSDWQNGYVTGQRRRRQLDAHNQAVSQVQAAIDAAKRVAAVAMVLYWLWLPIIGGERKLSSVCAPGGDPVCVVE